jgi:hypothetical protein
VGLIRVVFIIYCEFIGVGLIYIVSFNMYVGFYTCLRSLSGSKAYSLIR